MAILSFEAAVLGNDEVAPSIYILKLQCPEDFDFKPGQWLNVLLQKDGKPYGRPYSIASHASEKGSFQLCLKRVPSGYVSNYLSDLKTGEKVAIKGPFGVFLLKEPFEKDIIFIATGTGVAPFVPMVQEVLSKSPNSKVWLFFGVRHDEDVFYREFFEGLEKQYPNFKFIVTLSKPSPQWKGEQGYVQHLLAKNFSDGNNKQIYICGLPKMVEEVQAAALQLGIPKEKVYLEKY